LKVKFDYFVSAVGSGGSIMGVAKRLKPYGVKIIAVESKNSAPIYNKLYNKNLEIKPHLIQGIGAGFIPDNIDLDYIDDVVLVDDEEVIEFSKTFSKLGVTGGLSSVANFLAAKRLEGNIITLAPDSIERYLSCLEL
jgi:cysteine synthase A